MKNPPDQFSTVDKTKPMWLEELPCPVALFSRDRSFYLLNFAAKRMFQFSEEDLLSHPSLWAEQIDADDRDNFFKSQEELASRGNVVRCDYRFFPKGATEPIWIRELSIIANRQANIPWNIVSAFTEISDLQRRHSGAERIRKRIDILKPLFHDLQNRLQVLVMSLELAKRGLMEIDSDFLLQMVYSMKHSVENAQGCLNSSGRRGSLSCLNLSGILERVVGELRGELEHRQVRLHLLCREPLPNVHGDEKQIQTAIQRIIKSCALRLNNGGQLELETAPKKVGRRLYAQIRIHTSCGFAVGPNPSASIGNPLIGSDMAVASEILKNNQGCVSIKSQSENGGLVTISLKAKN